MPWSYQVRYHKKSAAIFDGVASFLRLPRQVMTSLSAEYRSTLDLVSVTIDSLIKMCDRGESSLQEVDKRLTATAMTVDLQRYRLLPLQEPAVVASSLNPKVPKQRNPAELAELTSRIRAVLQRR
jgi:hypothetical protein